MSVSENTECARQSDHDFSCEEEGTQKCCKCGISWLESVRGVSARQSGFEMPGKSFRHKRVLEAMGGGE